MIQVSLFASAVRPKLWPSLFKSLNGTSVSYEIVFCGNVESGTEFIQLKPLQFFHYIKTGDIKPAQCYEIARRNCRGETVIWIADDCEFPNDVIGKAYKYWKSQNNEKLILSLQTRETGYKNAQGSLFEMKDHCFFGSERDTPLMAPIGMMSRKFLEELGGIDKRYTCGQYENDLVMRAYQHGAKVEIFGGPDCFVDIDHLGKSIKIGECKNSIDFLQRPFASGYQEDRHVLENSWTRYDQIKLEKMLREGNYVKKSDYKTISPVQLDKFEPYEDEDILIKSQSNKGRWY